MQLLVRLGHQRIEALVAVLSAGRTEEQQQQTGQRDAAQCDKAVLRSHRSMVAARHDAAIAPAVQARARPAPMAVAQSIDEATSSRRSACAVTNTATAARATAAASAAGVVRANCGRHDDDDGGGAAVMMVQRSTLRSVVRPPFVLCWFFECRVLSWVNGNTCVNQILRYGFQYSVRRKQHALIMKPIVCDCDSRRRWPFETSFTARNFVRHVFCYLKTLTCCNCNHVLFILDVCPIYYATYYIYNAMVSCNVRTHNAQMRAHTLAIDFPNDSPPIYF